MKQLFIVWLCGLSVNAIVAGENFAPAVRTDATYMDSGTLAHHLSTNAVNYSTRVGGNSGDMLALSNWRHAPYSGTNLAFLTNAVWSTNFWLRGVQGLSATCIGFSNGLGGQGLVTMVSPRHYLFATHMHPEGYLTAFLDSNNVIHWRTTLQRVDVGNDTSVGILNADLPASVGYLPIVPTNLLNYLPTNSTSHLQGIGMNQDMRMFSQPLMLGNSPFVGWNSTAKIPNGMGTNWNIALRGGDSSNPVMLLVGNQLVLLSHNFSIGGGPNYSSLFTAINRGMRQLSTNNAVRADYQLTPFPLTNWTIINP